MFCGYLLALKNRSDLAIISAALMLSLRKTDVQSLSVQHNECDEAFFLLNVMNGLVFLYCFSNEFLLIHKKNDTKYLSSPVTYANLLSLPPPQPIYSIILARCILRWLCSFK